MEVFNFILKNYGPVVCSVVLMVYLCIFVVRNINKDEQKLKDSIVTLLRENAELKVELKKSRELLDEGLKHTNEGLKQATDKVKELEEQLDGLIKESEKDEPSNEEPKD